jgi:hypothetical protein
VVESKAGIPDWIPESISDRHDLAWSSVKEQDVEITLRCKLLTAVSTDRDDRATLTRTEQLDEPSVNQRGVGPAEGRALH